MKSYRLSKISIVPLLALAFSACGEEEQTNTDPVDITLNFSALVDGKDANCNTDYIVGTKNTMAKLADARIFVSEVELKNGDGDWIALSLIDDDWQHENLALLDFEDGTGACKDSGTGETNKTLTGKLAPGEYTDVRFLLGVPFELNHIDNATAPAPLNTPGMFWVWQGGYKFVRVDWLVTGGVLPRFNTHLGSTGCDSPGKTTPPEERCKKPNMAKLELPILSLENIKIVFDLKTMVAKTDLSTNIMESPPGCMSSPMEGGDCKEIYNTLGLNFAGGSCEDNCSTQTAFSVTD